MHETSALCKAYFQHVYILLNRVFLFIGASMEYEEHKEKLIYALAKRYSLPYHCEGTYYDIL